MRFAWLRTAEKSGQPAVMSPTGRLLLVAYNVVWWVPVALPLLGVVSYQAGTIGFLATSVVRAATNLYRNNVLTDRAAQRFPLRSP